MRPRCCAACRRHGSTSRRSGWNARSGRGGRATSSEAKTLIAGPKGDRSAAWWSERNLLARELLAAGRPADAYAVVVGHGLTKGGAFADAEFLAGWIALRHLKKPADGQKHFQTLYDGVSTAISKSRAAYWLGRSHEAAKRPKEANEWYAKRRRASARRSTASSPPRKVPNAGTRLPSDPVASAADRQSLGGRDLVTVARYLGQAGDADRARPFLLQLARFVTAPGETALLAQLAIELGRPDIALTIARRRRRERRHPVRCRLPRGREGDLQGMAVTPHQGAQQPVAQGLGLVPDHRGLRVAEVVLRSGLRLDYGGPRGGEKGTEDEPVSHLDVSPGSADGLP